jgi:hypothetical protein
MDPKDEWIDQLSEAEQKLEAAYEILAALHESLREAGRKKDYQAIGEVIERLVRYGRLFQDMRETWSGAEE